MSLTAPLKSPAGQPVIEGAPRALHRGERELPFVEFEPGVEMQVLQVDIPSGLWVIRMRLVPGAMLPTHKHAGEVFAFTISGAWKYLEYPEINRAGSYLYEPAASVHTLQALPSNEGPTDVWFAIRGPNLNLDAGGNVTLVLDAGLVLKVYLSRCRKLGVPRPDVIGA
ncbi:MAG TPA: 2,4'-dihydroxyacetophenone dioxygenase family protein [Burkholderiaceae bacterium]|jgi:quercetin dioxygenase-like cupin family protein|nr:2,4'-dihydroxyacetophenone dioxygenase family protein [Burkholderiaceae bacterium]